MIKKSSPYVVNKNANNNDAQTYMASGNPDCTHAADDGQQQSHQG